MEGLQIFHPTSRSDFQAFLKVGRRYRHPFNDKRLKKRLDQLLERMEQRRSATIAHLNSNRSTTISMYRLLANPKIQLSELIYEVCQIKQQAIADKDLIVPLDSSSFNLAMGANGRKDWIEEVGVVDDNCSPGFKLMPSLVLDASSAYCYGVADIVLYSRPQASSDPKRNEILRTKRSKLPLQRKESGAWSIVASNSAKQLVKAKTVTFVMDQGADNYESLALIRQQTKRDFLLRAKTNRQAKCLISGRTARLKDLLRSSPVSSTQTCYIKALNHISKTSLRVVRRKARNAKVQLKTLKVQILPPAGYIQNGPLLQEPLWLVQAREDPSTVPPGEQPIHWILLTSRPINNVQQAWQLVYDYQRRWDIEQLFRILKKQGYNVEKSQLDHPDKIKKLTVMATVASAKALALVAARDGEQFIDIATQFSAEEIDSLQIMSKKYDRQTEKTTNPYDPSSLAWAAWIIARAGGWSGYQSQRPPGPITMTKGLRELEMLHHYRQLLDGS